MSRVTETVIPAKAGIQGPAPGAAPAVEQPTAR